MAELIHLKDVVHNSNSVVTVGTFDGVHEGHRALIETVVKKAKQRKARSVVITFDPHPREIINPGADGIKMLTTPAERKEILEEMGIDEMVVIPFTRDFSLLSSEEFVKDIVFKKIGVSEFVIGYDHHFGKDRSGSIETIERLGKVLGYDAYVVSKKEMGNVTVSSTAIRKKLQEEGDVEQAAQLLGRPYILNGLVVHGEEIGRKLGYPTANLKPEHPNKILPKDGIYAVMARADSKWYKAMMSIGFRPTFGGTQRTLEVHLFDFDDNIYGKTIQIRFIARIRDEERYPDAETLRRHIQNDEKTARKILADIKM